MYRDTYFVTRFWRVMSRHRSLSATTSIRFTAAHHTVHYRKQLTYLSAVCRVHQRSGTKPNTYSCGDDIKFSTSAATPHDANAVQVPPEQW